MDRRPSEEIAGFLAFMEASREAYEEARQELSREDKRMQTFVHDIENAEDDEGLLEVARRFRESRRARRKAKDRMEMNRQAHGFCEGKQGKELLKALRRMQADQAGREEYLSREREFRKRVD